MNTATAATPTEMAHAITALQHVVASSAVPPLAVDIHGGKLTVRTAYDQLPDLAAEFHLPAPHDVPAASAGGETLVMVRAETDGVIDEAPCRFWATHMISVAEYAELLAAKAARR